jgi:hypothetical protein
MEDVEAADDALERRLSDPAPRVAPALREGERHELELDVDPLKGLRDRLPAGRARGCEGDDLVAPRRGLHQSGERAAHVVAHPGERVRERRDVVDDPHGAS